MEAAVTDHVTSNGAAITQFIGVGGFTEQVLVHENSVFGISEELPPWEPVASLL